MARPYKFYRFAYILIAAFFAVPQASAQEGYVPMTQPAPETAPVAAPQPDTSYTVTDVKVDVTADNAVNARQQAQEKAQQDAFAQLAARLAPGQTIPAPPAMTIATMVDDFEITQEQLSPVRYIGTYTFRFRPAAVQAWLGAHGSSAAASPVAGMAAPQPSMTMPQQPEPSGMNAAWHPQASAPAPSTAAATRVTARIRYTSLPQWIAAQQALRRVPGVTADILSMTSGEALVALNSPLPETQLAPALAQQGLTLGAPQAMTGWVPDSSAAVVRDLVYNR